MKISAKSPNTNATTAPHMYPSGMKTGWPDFRNFTHSRSVAPNTAGIEIRNENRNASLIPNPMNNAIAIDIPERDTPGNTAIPCANPTNIAMLSNDEFLRDDESMGIITRTIPVKISPAPTSIKLSENFSAVDFNARPITAVIIDAIIIAQPYAQPERLFPNQPPNHSRNICNMSRQKYRTTARSVAKCRSISNVSMFSPKPMNI